MPTPAVTSVTPYRTDGGGGTTVSIAGTGFANAAAIMFGTNAATIISDSDTLLVVSSPAATVAGPVDVTVTTLGGTSAAIAADQFTYAPLPTIISLTPSSGPVAGGTIVTITGTNLTNGSVKFGNNWATIQSGFRRPNRGYQSGGRCRHGQRDSDDDGRDVRHLGGR